MSAAPDLSSAGINPYLVSSAQTSGDDTVGADGPVVLGESDKECLQALCNRLVAGWRQSVRPQQRGDVSFTVTTNDDLTQSLYQCQALYKAAFSVKNEIEDRQAMVCGWLTGLREPVCSCRLTMAPTLRECAIVGSDTYRGEMEPGDTADCLSVDTKVGCMQIDNFAVLPSHQRSKIGTALAAHVKTWARERSHGFIKRLSLSVDYDKIDNCEFYSRLGFVVDDFDDNKSEVNMAFYYEDDPGLHRP